MPLISIALPVFNGADFLAEALDSILTQDFGDYELVVADNASTDATAEIIAERARRDPRIRHERASTTVSQVANVNRAANLCIGEWIQFFCHDDVMAPGCLSRLSGEVATADAKLGLIGHGTGLLYGKRVYVTAEDVFDGKPQPFAGAGALETVPIPTFAPGRAHVGFLMVQAMLRGRRIEELPGLTNACVRREAWISFGAFDGRYMHFDTFGWACLLLHWNYLFLPGTFTLTRIHGAQVAVAARKTLRSVTDHLAFWPAFRAGPAKNQVAGWWPPVVGFLKAVSIGAAAIATEILKGRRTRAWEVARLMPVTFWPWLPFFVVRNWRTQGRRIARLRGQLSLEEIWP